MPQPTEAEKRNLLSVSFGFHPDGPEPAHAPGSLEHIPAGFAAVVLSLRVGEHQNVIPSLVGPLSMPTLHVGMHGLDGRHQLGDGRPMPLGVDEAMHALVGGITILAQSLPKSDLRQRWCNEVAQSFMRFQSQGQAPAKPPAGGVA